MPQFLGVPWTDALTAIGTTAAVVVALLLGFWVNGLSDTIFRPRLKASILPRLPDCHVVDATSPTIRNGQVVVDALGLPVMRKVSDQYYCRLRITNGGSFCRSASEVELRLFRLWDVSVTPAQEVTTFLPLNLTWSHVVTSELRPERRQLMALIQPRVFRHCDLCHVDDRAPRDLRFNAEPEPNPIGGVRATIKPPGKYELDLILAAANFEPEIVTVSIDFTGRWPAGGNYRSLVDVSVLRQSRTPPTQHPV